MFTEIKQTSKTHTNYTISYNLHNGKKDKTYTGLIETTYYPKFLETKKVEYIKNLVNNYVLHKKTLHQVEAKHYEIDTKTLIALNDCLIENEIIQQEKSLLTICKRILKSEEYLMYLRDTTSQSDHDRLTNILTFAKENSL